MLRRELRNAARVGETFRLDPVTILKAGRFDTALRIAAHNIVVRDKNRRQKHRTPFDEEE